MEEPTTQPKEPSAGPALTRPILVIGGAVLAVAGFFGGYVVKDATADERGFGSGMMVDHTRTRGPMGPGGRGGFDGPMGGPDGRRGNPAFGPVAFGPVAFGTVKSVTGSTVTLTTPDGNTMKVSVDSDARVMVTTKGSIKDLAKGDKIVVRGQREGDTIDADVIAKGRDFGSRQAR